MALTRRPYNYSMTYMLTFPTNRAQKSISFGLLYFGVLSLSSDAIFHKGMLAMLVCRYCAFLFVTATALIGVANIVASHEIYEKFLNRCLSSLI